MERYPYGFIDIHEYLRSWWYKKIENNIDYPGLIPNENSIYRGTYFVSLSNSTDSFANCFENKPLKTQIQNYVNTIILTSCITIPH